MSEEPYQWVKLPAGKKVRVKRIGDDILIEEPGQVGERVPIRTSCTRW